MKKHYKNLKFVLRDDVVYIYYLDKLFDRILGSFLVYITSLDNFGMEAEFDDIDPKEILKEMKKNKKEMKDTLLTGNYPPPTQEQARAIVEDILLL